MILCDWLYLSSVLFPCDCYICFQERLYLSSVKIQCDLSYLFSEMILCDWLYLFSDTESVNLLCFHYCSPKETSERPKNTQTTLNLLPCENHQMLLQPLLHGFLMRWLCKHLQRNLARRTIWLLRLRSYLSRQNAWNTNNSINSDPFKRATLHVPVLVRLNLLPNIKFYRVEEAFKFQR